MIKEALLDIFSWILSIIAMTLMFCLVFSPVIFIATVLNLVANA